MAMKCCQQQQKRTLKEREKMITVSDYERHEVRTDGA